MSKSGTNAVCIISIIVVVITIIIDIAEIVGVIVIRQIIAHTQYQKALLSSFDTISLIVVTFNDFLDETSFLENQISPISPREI